MAKGTELILNCDQAIIYFKLIEANKRLTEKRFSGQIFTVKEWKAKLEQDKLL